MTISPPAKYVVGVDFGTESGRAVLVDVTTYRRQGRSGAAGL
jgi:ribulose kinase